MQPFKKFTSSMAYLPIANIDTDMIIPKQYLKTVGRTGLGKHLFAELRYDEANRQRADFILNQPDYQESEILLTEENFGCGSSREHAVWSLIDFGIKVIIAPSFAEIFYSNCFKNGLLPIILAKEQIITLASLRGKPVMIDLEMSRIQIDSLVIPFVLDDFRRQALLSGLDEIGQTLTISQKIRAYEHRQKRQQPWLYYEGDKHA